MPGEQDIAGVLAQQELRKKEALEFSKKIDAVNEQVKNIQKRFSEGMEGMGKQIQSLAASKDDHEILKKWDEMSDVEKRMSPLIPRNAYATQLEAIFSDAENIPGLKARVTDLLTGEDIEKFLTEDPTGEKVAETLCTSEKCRLDVKKRIEEFQKKHHLKEKKLFEKS